MQAGNEQYERISHFETILNDAAAAKEALFAALDTFEALFPKLESLAAYYGSEVWKRDFSDDEAGLLASDLRRGVLSEDGVYDLLEEIGALQSRMADLAARPLQ